MKKGFLDHWVPTAKNYSKFWMSDIETVKSSVAAMRDEVYFDSFTFYTKWYTNGIRSDLPFLRNHPEASNNLTGNRWGRELLDFLHGKGIEATALLQLYTYEQPEWAPELSIGDWDVKICAGNEENIVIADFTEDLYRDRIKALIGEQIRNFPEFDNMFFEFEGVFPQHLKVLYDKWAPSLGLPASDNVTYATETLDFVRSTGQPQSLLWSNEGREFLRHFYKLNMIAAGEALAEAGFKGRKGICFHIYDYESFIYPDLAAEIGDWCLVPWNYWLWTRRPFDECRRVAEAAIRQWKKSGHKIYYIGDVTIGSVPKYSDVLTEFYRGCEAAEIEGYIGMGYPDREIGLRWTNVTDESIAASKELYKHLYKKEI